MEPYNIVFTRVDKVTRVPNWAKEYVKVGDLVWRLDRDTVRSTIDNRLVGLGESYTKFVEYRNPYTEK
jgi:hypothetical protein